MGGTSGTRIVQVDSGRGMRDFVRLPYDLYRGDPLWVPPLLAHERAQFDSRRNPAFEYCDAGFFLAVREGRPVGRVAAVLNKRYVEKTGRACGRFAWFECEDDEAAGRALMSTAEGWLVERGMEEASGPMGFTDNDRTGFLVEGFEELPPIAGSYNPPWYNDLVTSLGYEKEVDYVEYRIEVPERVPERMERLVELIRSRTSVRVFSETSAKRVARRWGRQVFDVLNEAFEELYGTTRLSDREIEYYIDMYLGQVDPEFIKLAADGDRLVGFIIAMPNLSRAFQKAGGRLFPTGFAHVLRAMRRSRGLDFYLAGVRPEYRKKGVAALLGFEIARSAVDRGMEYAESNHELEGNSKIQAMWKPYDKRLHRRSRVYNRSLV